ncbi:response regulator [Salinimicrobium sp. GXAS 041]|uniref:response regulator n=1 Tax=Salinimicrobium sp. GXAS 041 TaxID=3400806 RepID=UPI003C727B06
MKKIHHFIVIDDDSTNNLICNYTIKRFDREANVRLFEKPENALQVISKEYANLSEARPTVLFLDINMPSMTGWEVLEEFKNFDNEIREQFKIYMLSSSIEDLTQERDQYPFLAGFISKPLKVEKLQDLFNEQK